MTSLRRCSVVLVALLLVAAACGGGDDDDSSSGGGGGGGNSDLAEQCPIGSIDELAASEKPVEITYWHSFPQENERLITEITDAFNASQNDVKVKLVNQTSYGDTLTAFRAAYGKADSPDFVLLEDKETQQMIDSQAVIPAQACVDADNYDMSDFLPRVTDYFTVEDTLWPMPFNVSNPVLYYNRALFTQAGLDPDQPPTTLDEVKEQSQTIVDAGAAPHGWALNLDSWLLEQWTAMAGKEFVDNGNGRDARATKVTFDNDAGLEVFRWTDEMYKSGLAENTGRPESNINYYLAVGNKTSAMTAGTSAALGIVLSVIGQYPGVELGVAPLPGLPGDGATFVGGGANYLVKGDDPAKIEAAWRYAKYLDDPETQAKWAQTGYIPIRQKAVDSPALQQLWQSQPFYKVAFDQLASDNATVAAKGPVIGDFAGVKAAEIDALEAMVTNGISPEDALQQAADNSNKAITDYNERAGVGG
jgi:sn-glycerol 3-phosphate transport system substrate-binding protein